MLPYLRPQEINLATVSVAPWHGRWCVAHRPKGIHPRRQWLALCPFGEQLSDLVQFLIYLLLSIEAQATPRTNSTHIRINLSQQLDTLFQFIFVGTKVDWVFSLKFGLT